MFRVFSSWVLSLALLTLSAHAEAGILDWIGKFGNKPQKEAPAAAAAGPTAQISLFRAYKGEDGAIVVRIGRQLFYGSNGRYSEQTVMNFGLSDGASPSSYVSIHGNPSLEGFINDSRLSMGTDARRKLNIKIYNRLDETTENKLAEDFQTGKINIVGAPRIPGRAENSEYHQINESLSGAPTGVAPSLHYPAQASENIGPRATEDQSPSAMMHTLLSGPPVLANGPLDPAAYVSMDVPRLAHPGLAYVNWRALGIVLRRLGYTEIPDHLTPHLAKAILDEAGFAMQLKGEPNDAFIQDFIKLYSVRYGGQFLNYNFGDAGGASGGYIQRKRVGQTPLLRPNPNSSHASGNVEASEGVHEALWAEIFDQELPLGANPVLFIITTGTLINPEDPNSEPRILILRDDMVRLAYYERNTGVFENMEEALRNYHIQGDQARMEAVIKKFTASLPLPQNLKSGSTLPEYLRAAFFQLVENVALQYASAYVHQLYHGATSTSNMMIDAGFLDFGTSSAVRGFQRLRILDSESPNGDTLNLKTDLLWSILKDLRMELPGALAAHLPSDEEVGKLLDDRFLFYKQQGFLELAGSPRELSHQLALRNEGAALSNTLMQIVKIGNEQIQEGNESFRSPRKGPVDLKRVLELTLRNILPRQNPAEPRILRQRLMSATLWKELQTNYEAFYKALQIEAKKEGISGPALDKAIRIGVAARTTTLEELRDGKRARDNFAQASRNFLNGDLFAVQNLIDGIVERSVHEFKREPFVLETADRTGPTRGLSVRHRLDLKTGEETTVSVPLAGVRSKAAFSTLTKPSCEGVFSK